jgi:SAM-dependent methyltransferase
MSVKAARTSGQYDETHTRFLEVTEIQGQLVTNEQYYRHCNRYYWAGDYCTGKDVLEAACGAAAGIGYLQRTGARMVGIDISEAILAGPRAYYGNCVDLRAMDAQNLQFPDSSFDVVIIFEALYYLRDPEEFVAECARVLRPQGQVLVCNANKDLYDFNRSPFSHEYHGVRELGDLFGCFGFSTQFWGGSRLGETTLRQKIVRPAKAVASKLGLIPKTMAGKRLLKRIVFGKLSPLPAEIEPHQVDREPLDPLPAGMAATGHKVIYCVATLNAGT